MKNSASVTAFPATGSKHRQAGRTLPKAPHTLSREAKGRWRELVVEYGIEDAAGLQILGAAMEALDRLRLAQAQIAQDGQTHLDRFGQMKAHPLLPVERDSRAAMLAGLKALNLDLEPIRDRPGRPTGGAR